MEEKHLQRCPCGRNSTPITKRVLGKFSDGQRRIFWAPWCSPRPCRPLTPEERKDPGFKIHWCKLPARVVLDAGIKALVITCREAGLGTLTSCDGHSKHSPYIYFYDREDRDKAITLLGKFVTLSVDESHPLLGTWYGLLFPEFHPT